jgi:hypothetical protein
MKPSGAPGLARKASTPNTTVTPATLSQVLRG